MTPKIGKRLFSVDDYHRMAETGILNEDDRVELIEGEIVEMNPIGSRHAASVERVGDLLKEAVGGRAMVRLQNPIQLSRRSEPQPDVALVKRRADYYAEAHPRPADVLLLIEVADASIANDRNIKLPLYARAGIPEVWLIDLEAQVVEVHRDPAPGGFAETLRIPRGSGGILTVQGLPGISIETDRILG